jgi:hypothetical protein
MQAIDAPDFEALLQQVAECYDRKPPSEAAAKMWFTTLKDFLYPDVRSTLLHWIKTKSKAPTIAEIITQLRDRQSGGLERRAVEDKRAFQSGAARMENPPTEHGKACMALIREKLPRMKKRRERIPGEDDE